MPDRTNVTDALFPNDNVFNDYYERDVVASQEDHRNVINDYYDTAIIFTGLTIEDGTIVDTVMVRLGRGADINGYRVIVPLDVDNVATLDNTGNINYVAIRHVWAYSLPDLPAKAGAVTYNTVRSDDYEINVALIQQNEAAGWILLGYMWKVGGVWYYATDIPTNRSRNARMDIWDDSFGYAGVIPVAANLMYYHGVQGARVHPPTTVLIQQMQCSVMAAPAVGTITFQMRINGLIPGWAPTVTIPIGGFYNSAELGTLSTEIDRTDYIDVLITGNAGHVFGANAFCRISGTVRSGI